MVARLGGGSGTRGGLCGNSGTDGVAQAVAWSSPTACCNICSLLEKVCAPKNEPVLPQRAPRLPRTQVTPVVDLRGFLSISHAHNHFGFCKKF